MTGRLREIVAARVREELYNAWKLEQHEGEP